MYLKKLELSGFKSFAKSTVLEFPHKITAIVGPNGSGKSNLKEAIQWVLGEQSMKSIRAKLGEDLIWNGSPQIPRVGKASVVLTFDNSQGKIPLDFEEVLVSRKIFRDGANEYYLNNSQVRLKDVMETMAGIGLGETKHNIISQGEVDRILVSSPRERREMLEEALGLRIYQLKKNEAERKLEATENNMRQVEALSREIAPHLRFLRSQAQKAEARGKVQSELLELERVYLAQENKNILSEKELLKLKSSPLSEKQGKVRERIKELIGELAEIEKTFETELQASEDDKKFKELEIKRRELGRELGRIEGRLEVERQNAARASTKSVDMKYIEEEIRTFLNEVKEILENEDQIETVRSHILALAEDLENLLADISKGTISKKGAPAESPLIRELEKTIRSMQEDLIKTDKEIAKFESARASYRGKYLSLQQKNRELDAELRKSQEEERNLALQLERFKFDEERLNLREKVFLQELQASGISKEELEKVRLDDYESLAAEELKRKIERLRLKVEEIGGIDPAVIKEYQDTDARHSFLARELDDLKKAHLSLKELIKELDRQIKYDFKEGFSKIKEEFHKLFRMIFGGGKATLQMVEEKQNTEEEGLPSEALAQEGVDIAVELPRKRIKGLAMLSGGERALTSIALLFAITAVNPPPFLVLDETDAALDEANSQRYSAILKELAKKTQLIIVTHNRETMKSAGILYGVTIGDDGVSKLLSLKLEEAESYTNR